jgi:hypothetical protein
MHPVDPDAEAERLAEERKRATEAAELPRELGRVTRIVVRVEFSDGTVHEAEPDEVTAHIGRRHERLGRSDA